MMQALQKTKSIAQAKIGRGKVADLNFAHAHRAIAAQGAGVLLGAVPVASLCKMMPARQGKISLWAGLLGTVKCS